VHSIGNLNSTPPFSYYLGNDFSRADNLASMTYGDIEGPQQAGPYLRGGVNGYPPHKTMSKKKTDERSSIISVVFKFFKCRARERWGQFSATPYARQAKSILILGIFSPPNKFRIGSFCSLSFHFPFSRSYFVQFPFPVVV